MYYTISFEGIIILTFTCIYSYNIVMNMYLQLPRYKYNIMSQQYCLVASFPGPRAVFRTASDEKLGGAWERG